MNQSFTSLEQIAADVVLMTTMSMFSDILKEIGGDFLFQMMRRVNTESQAVFAKKTDLGESKISEYKNSKRCPTTALEKISEVTNLNAHQLGWLIGYLLEQTYRPHRFELYSRGDDAKADEVREPHIPYGKPTLEERLEMLQRLDLNRLNVSSEDRIVLARTYKTLRQTCERTLTAHQQLAADLEELINGFEDSIQAARLRQARNAKD